MSTEDYLLVCDQMPWFRSLLSQSLINKNQIHAYGIPVFDDPFESKQEFCIASYNVFIPLDTMGKIVHFESRTPNDWEIKHLSVILLTREK